MNFKLEKRYLYWGATAFAVIAASSIFLVAVYNFKSIADKLNEVATALNPVFIGFILAYLLTPVENFFEKKCFRPLFTKISASAKIRKLRINKNAAASEKDRDVRIKKISRVLGVVCAIITAVLAFAALLSAIIPQTVIAVQNLIDNLGNYTEALSTWAGGVLERFPDALKSVTNLIDVSQESLTEWLMGLLPQITDATRVFQVSKDTVGVLINSILGFFICIYLLYGKELFAAQGKKTLFALFKPKTANVFLTNLRDINRLFGGFITGKIIDSVIIGAIFFIVLTILGVPYTVLLSVILGVTNVIPYFGPFIGAVPCVFIVLMENPLQALYLIIVIVVVQQFDGNFLGPKILGDITGLSSFWVIFALLLGQYFFGIMGLVIGVPLFAVLYSLIKTRISQRLEEKGLPPDTNIYRGVSSIDEESGELVAVKEPEVRVKKKPRTVKHVIGNVINKKKK